MIPGEVKVSNYQKRRLNRYSILKPYIRQTGDGNIGPNTVHLGKRKLLDYLLLYVDRGSIEILLNNKKQTVAENQLLWIPPNKMYDCWLTKGVHTIYIHFDLIYNPKRSHWDALIPGGTLDLRPYADKMHPKIADKDINALSGVLELANAHVIKELMRFIAKEHTRSGDDSLIILSGMMLRVIGEVLRGKINLPYSGSYWQKIHYAAEKIRKGIYDNINVKQLVDEIQLSESYFRVLFKKAFGVGPREMHRNIRIQKSKELLLYSELTITDIAFRLGFSTIHNFSRAFQKIVGISPSEYRNGHHTLSQINYIK
ncbi:MAG TPA: helix-turn-helix transcriptional regulator [Spirochaetota bacterium]|nr:helix-turn-helix transcriptional regulator [Spirochaetota bacterium]